MQVEIEDTAFRTEPSMHLVSTTATRGCGKCSNTCLRKSCSEIDCEVTEQGSERRDAGATSVLGLAQDASAKAVTE